MTHNLKILLDIDGVLVTTPSWRGPEILPDGFMKFNDEAALNMEHLLKKTKGELVLTTTHRVNYSIGEWKRLFEARGIYPAEISKVNDAPTIKDLQARSVELCEWVNNQGNRFEFLIIDDDQSLYDLPVAIKEKCVITSSMVGFDIEALNKALKLSNSR